jgi:hypothetical protein
LCKHPPNPLSILFAGEAYAAKLVNNSSVPVFVRALPQQFLGDFLAVAEQQHLVVELCCYLRAPRGAAAKRRVTEATPVIPPPHGMKPVPVGWSQNLSDESFEELYAAACRLNFTRAANWGQRQIAAKKTVAPIQQAVLEQVAPLIEKMVTTLLQRCAPSSTSTPSAPSSPAAPASSSSPSPSPG